MGAVDVQQPEGWKNGELWENFRDWFISRGNRQRLLRELAIFLAKKKISPEYKKKKAKFFLFQKQLLHDFYKLPHAAK